MLDTTTPAVAVVDVTAQSPELDAFRALAASVLPTASTVTEDAPNLPAVVVEPTEDVPAEADDVELAQTDGVPADVEPFSAESVPASLPIGDRVALAVKAERTAERAYSKAVTAVDAARRALALAELRASDAEADLLRAIDTRGELRKAQLLGSR